MFSSTPASRLKLEDRTTPAAHLFTVGTDAGPVEPAPQPVRLPRRHEQPGRLDHRSALLTVGTDRDGRSGSVGTTTRTGRCPMNRITLFHHPDCGKCRRIARVHQAFDWRNRVAVSTGTPATGPLQPGRIAVLDHSTGVTTRGGHAVRRIVRNIPAYTPLRPLLWLPAVARAIDRGCSAGGCTVPQRPGEQS
jgi:hypothetical protein